MALNPELLRGRMQDYLQAPVGRRRVLQLSIVTLAIIGLGDEAAQKNVIASLVQSPAAEVSLELGNGVDVILSEDAPAKWDLTSLAITATVLSNAGSNLLAPKNGIRPQIMLTSNPANGLDDAASYAYDPNRPFEMGMIKIKPERVAFSNLRYIPEDYLHEIGHMKTMTNGNEFQDALLSSINQPFADFARAINNKTEPFKYIDITNSEANLDLAHTAGRLQRAVAAEAELPAVVTELYIRGRAGFEIISNWVDPDLTNRWYEMAKDLIFNGREYSGRLLTDGLIFDPHGNVIEAPVLGIYKPQNK